MTLRVILAVIVIVIAVYGLITENFEFQLFMMFFLSLMMLVMGLDEIRKGRKVTGWFNIVSFLFVFIVSLQGFFFK